MKWTYFRSDFNNKKLFMQGKMIYAKNGILVDKGVQKKFQLISGRVINNEKSKINIFDFDQIDFNLKTFDTNTIIVPKIQEIS